VNWSWKDEEPGFQALRVKSCVSYTKTSVVVGLLIVFLATSSLKFPTKIFLVTCARETLINEWDVQVTDINEGAHSFCWTSQEEESWWKTRIVVEGY
jgi:hypothetical protein